MGLHRCPENDGTFTSNDEHGAVFTMNPLKWTWFAFHMPWDEGGWPWWGWVVFLLLASTACGCCLCFCAIFGVCWYNTYPAPVTDAKGRRFRDDSESASDSSDSESDRKSRRAPKL